MKCLKSESVYPLLYLPELISINESILSTFFHSLVAMAVSKTPMCLYGSPPTVRKSDINSTLPFFLEPRNGVNLVTRRLFTWASSISSLVMISSASSAETPPSKSFLAGISSTKSWFQFYGDGFSIRVPPAFEDITEPEVFLCFSLSIFWVGDEWSKNMSLWYGGTLWLHLHQSKCNPWSFLPPIILNYCLLLTVFWAWWLAKLFSQPF